MTIFKRLRSRRSRQLLLHCPHQWDLDDILTRHYIWWETGGRMGARVRIEFIDLRNVQFRGTNLRQARIDTCDLRGTDLRGADLREAVFVHADLRGADLRGANLRGTEFWYSQLDGAQLDLGIRDCTTLTESSFTPDALPWLILHPSWGWWQATHPEYISITGSTEETHIDTCAQLHDSDHSGILAVVRSGISWFKRRPLSFLRRGVHVSARFITWVINSRPHDRDPHRN